jgi:hypothetical protein
VIPCLKAASFEPELHRVKYHVYREIRRHLLDVDDQIMHMGISQVVVKVPFNESVSVSIRRLN